MKCKTSGNIGEMALKIDISKAYDRVSWEYLRQLMLKLGFDARWVELIMVMVSSTRFHISFNGKLLGPIHPSRSLHQGDLISLYIFILCVEGLSLML